MTDVARAGYIDPNRKHWFLEGPAHRRCYRGNCGERRGHPIHLTEYDRTTESRYFLERDDLG
jgi:hypothetical protein